MISNTSRVTNDSQICPLSTWRQNIKSVGCREASSSDVRCCVNTKWFAMWRDIGAKGGHGVPECTGPTRCGVDCAKCLSLNNVCHVRSGDSDMLDFSFRPPCRCSSIMSRSKACLLFPMFIFCLQSWNFVGHDKISS